MRLGQRHGSDAKKGAAVAAVVARALEQLQQPRDLDEPTVLPGLPDDRERQRQVEEEEVQQQAGGPRTVATSPRLA